MVGVITLLSIFIAVYSLIPRHTRIELTLRIGEFTIIVSLLLFIFIVYLNSISLLEALGAQSCAEQKFLKDNSDSITLWIFLFIILLLIIKWSLFSLSRRKLNKFGNLISQLIHEGRVLEMSDIFLKYHKKILKYSESNTKYYNFIEKELQKRPDPSIMKEILANITAEVVDNQVVEISSLNTLKHDASNFHQKIYKSLKNLKYRTMRRFLLLLPKGVNYKSKARENLRLAVLSPKVIKFWTSERPHDLIKLLDANLQEVFEISNQLLHDQLSDIKSYLYYELEDTQNYFGKSGYSISEDNLIVFSLLGNSKRADHLHIWQPVGDYILKYLDDLFHSADDQYNRPCAEFTLEGKWSSPIYVAIHFFDIMVTTALTQESPSNMWLFYYYYFIESIVRNSNLDNSLIDLTYEWPNRYCYLLYRIISNLKTWILYSENIKTPKENVIIINAFFCLSLSLNKIVQSDQLSEKFIVYIYEIVLGIYFDLRKKNQQKLSNIFLSELVYGKFDSYSNEYRSLLKDMLNSIDTIPWRFNDNDGWEILNSSLDKIDKK